MRSCIFWGDEFGGTEWVPNGPATWNSTTKQISIPIKTHPQYTLRSETIVYTLNATDPVPDAPTGLIGGVYTSNTVLIGWGAPNFVTKFEIERATSSPTGYTKIAEVTPNIISYKDLDPTLVAGTQYYYRVRAVNAAGNSPYSNEISVTTSSAYNFDPFNNLGAKMYFTVNNRRCMGRP
ncbi:MAG: fibronectin type III domain-containing protein [Bacteroidota bacterium]